MTARSHALEMQRAVEETKDVWQANAAIDTLAKQLDLIGDVLAGNEGFL
jgi:hypothetical protein